MYGKVFDEEHILVSKNRAQRREEIRKRKKRNRKENKRLQEQLRRRQLDKEIKRL